MLGRGGLLPVLLAVSCFQGEPASRERDSLIDHQRWQEVESSEDPFFEDALEGERCTASDYGVEGEGEYSFFEVVTTECNYLTVTQPSRVGVGSGDLLELTLWHLPLVATEEGEAVLIVTLGDRTIFREIILVPSAEKVYSSIVSADFDAPKGAPIRFHVHNHGVNAWRFYAFEVRR